MNKVPIELYAIINSFLNKSLDIIALKCVSKTFNIEIKKIKIQIIKLKEEFKRQRNPRIYRLICVNNNCHNVPNKLLYHYCMEMITFYYSKEIMNKNNQNSVSYREDMCLKESNIKRFIPYCFDCMQEYIEYGKYKDDPWSVPFGKDKPEYFI